MTLTKTLNKFSIKTDTVLWLFMFIVLVTAPLFPGKGKYGFYSVEWSFFFFSAILIHFTMLTLLFRSRFTFKWDSIYIFLIAFLMISSLSIIDTVNKIRGLLFIGQYIPYFFLMILLINTLDSEDKLNRVLTMIICLAFIFSLVTILLAIIFRDRERLNDFLLNNFNISVNKVLTYIELPFCISIFKLVRNKFNIYNIFFCIAAILAIVVSGSRGSLLVMGGMLALTLIKGRNFKKTAVIMLTLLMVIGIGMLASKYTRDRLSKLFVSSERNYEENIASFSRLYTAEVALKLTKDHPINGVGIGNSSGYMEGAIKHLSLPSSIVDYWKRRSLFETTSTPLKLGSELGFAGIFFFIVFFYYLWRRVKKDFSTVAISDKLIHEGMKIYIIVAFVHNFIDLGFTNYYSWFYYGTVLAATRINIAEKYRRYCLDNGVHLGGHNV